MDLLGIVPVFIPMGHSHGKHSPEEVKAMIGVFIFLNIVWITSLAITAFKKLTGTYEDSFMSYRGVNSNNFFAGFLDLLMLIVWATAIIVVGGAFISSLF